MVPDVRLSRCNGPHSASCLLAQRHLSQEWRETRCGECATIGHTPLPRADPRFGVDRPTRAKFAHPFAQPFVLFPPAAQAEIPYGTRESEYPSVPRGSFCAPGGVGAVHQHRPQGFQTARANERTGQHSNDTMPPHPFPARAGFLKVYEELAELLTTKTLAAYGMPAEAVQYTKEVRHGHYEGSERGRNWRLCPEDARPLTLVRQPHHNSSLRRSLSTTSRAASSIAASPSSTRESHGGADTVYPFPSLHSHPSLTSSSVSSPTPSRGHSTQPPLHPRRFPYRGRGQARRRARLVHRVGESPPPLVGGLLSLLPRQTPSCDPHIFFFPSHPPRSPFSSRARSSRPSSSSQTTSWTPA